MKAEPDISGDEMDKGRTGSVDIFRGITVVLMILVNNPGNWSAIYKPLRHAAWHGLLPADLVFPFFLFIMGVSIELSMRARSSRDEDKGGIPLHVIRRTAILFLLGLFLNGFPFYPAGRVLEIRIPGVLQRIAVVYCVTSFLCLWTRFRVQAAFFAVLLAGYYSVCMFIPVPGTGCPNIEPGTNFAAWLDRLLLHGHLWKVTGTWDPEGILSTISAVGTCITGAWAGRILLSDRDEGVKTICLASAGSVFALAGLAWHPFFPINKNLWTGPYVLCTAGIAAVCLAFLYHAIDVKRSLWWTGPFMVTGVNSLAAFFLSSLAARCMNVIHVSAGGNTVSLQSFLYKYLFAANLGMYNASLAWALVMAVIWIVIMAVLYKKKIFIKL